MTATWLVGTADTAKIETWTFPLQVTGTGDLSQIQVSATLGPVSDVSAASATATAPVPRYRDFSVPQKLVNLRVSSALQLPPGSSNVPAGLNQRASVRIGRDSIPVGSNLTFLLQILNDTADPNQSATGVAVQDNLPLGLIFQSCQPVAACSIVGNVVVGNFGALGPGDIRTLQILAQIDPTLANGTVLTNLVSGNSDQVIYDPTTGLASNSFTVGASPAMKLTPSTLNFGCSGQTISGAQPVTINFTGAAGLNWTATAGASNIKVNNANQVSGSGDGAIMVGAGLAGGSCVVTTTQSVSVSAPGVGAQSQQITVNIIPVNLSTPIIGSFDTPKDNTTNVAGAIPVTGWALDSVGVTKVDIWREPVGNEATGPNGLVYVGDAVFVDGARPDVQKAFPNMPFNSRAGWGYLMLTTGLPNNGGAAGPGNGTYKLHAIAHNVAGQSLDMGTRTITVDNANAINPFGSIDTPGQGETISGSAYLNFGWALAHKPNCIPIDASTITVTVDGIPLGHPAYNFKRDDIANSFPGLCNTNGAVGFMYIDTTKLSNGLHAIGWLVYDNVGHGDGLGSRFINVLNSGGPAAMPEQPVAVTNKVSLRRGYDLQPKAEELTPNEEGVRVIQMAELERIELEVGATQGHLIVNGESYPLPNGSVLQRGVFTWQAAPGFLGDYDLRFERADGTQVPVRVHIRPKAN
jgi:hypothetical protein